ncbi:MAG: hypothetical protein J7K21_04065, partial [Desulfurococcales archaeon]|nr:hypothetical protein [Desulfurococcales archaeon]
LHLVRGYYIELIPSPPPIEEYEKFTGIGFIYPLQELLAKSNKVNYPMEIIILGNISLPSSRIAVALTFFGGESTPIYYDMVTGILVRVDLWKNRYTLIYSDSILEKIFRINYLSSTIHRTNDKFSGTEPPFKAIPVSIVLVDSNIPFTRPVFGAVKPVRINTGWSLVAIVMGVIASVLLTIILYLAYKRLGRRAD